MIDIKFDFREFDRKAAALGKTESNMRFVTSYALNNALKDTREEEVKVMRSVFDRPTRFTLNALAVRPSTKADPFRGELYFKEGFGSIPAWKYLGPQVEGGPRRHKRFERLLQRAGIMNADEFVVPSKRLQLDAYGNIPGSLLTRILSALSAQSDRMQNTTAKSRKRKPKRNMDYVVFRGHNAGAPDGVYLRKPNFAVPVLLFVRSPSYRKRFPYYETARRALPPAFARHFAVGFQRFIVDDVRRA
ncbi:hypothetical protein [Chelatococcus reniformis]|uniref:Uncharacterized protein n=1 Tax=Chelatococcus reniformis TaxID=1494448 RepID=A0A916XFP0_9HYPH|nr:hypothetical protein [Chelatococcus reniformis]GGC68466.1 hypothetical protein GCM10010994_28810 [Chelatococcus reniformis]